VLAVRKHYCWQGGNGTNSEDGTYSCPYKCDNLDSAQCVREYSAHEGEGWVQHIRVVLYRDVNHIKVFVYSLQHPSNCRLPGVAHIVFLQIISNPPNDGRGIVVVLELRAESL